MHFRTDTYLHENALRALANQLFGLAKVAAADAKRLGEKRKGETIASGVAPAAKKGGSSAAASSSAQASAVGCPPKVRLTTVWPDNIGLRSRMVV